MHYLAHKPGSAAEAQRAVLFCTRVGAVGGGALLFEHGSWRSAEFERVLAFNGDVCIGCASGSASLNSRQPRRCRRRRRRHSPPNGEKNEQKPLRATHKYHSALCNPKARATRLCDRFTRKDQPKTPNAGVPALPSRARDCAARATPCGVCAHQPARQAGRWGILLAAAAARRSQRRLGRAAICAAVAEQHGVGRLLVVSQDRAG